MNAYILVDGVKKSIGQIYPEECLFVKEVHKSKHLHRKTDSWGIDADFLKEKLTPNNFTIRVVDKDDFAVYQADADAFNKDGIYLQFPNCGLQKFLAREKWKTWSC